MTVLADHGSPYRAHTLPRRSTLHWQDRGCHYLTSDAQGALVLADFLHTRSAHHYKDLRAVPMAALLPALAAIGPQDHLLAAGAEPYLQRLQALAWASGLREAQLLFQRIGAERRDVICMQCRRICRDLGQRIHLCGCGTHLLVRDHFSARLGLYQGAPLPPDDPLITALGGRTFDG